MAVSVMKEDVAQYKKELILRAAGELFFQHGYTATTTDALTERLSISKTMIYQHFRSKLEMLSIICERAVSESVAVAAQAAMLPGPADERLTRLVHDFTLVVIEHHQWIAISYRELNTPPEDVRQRIIAKQEEFDRIARTLIEDGVRDDVFRVADPAATALAIAGMIIWVHTWYRATGRLEPEEIAATLAQSALRMVGVDRKPG
jgi:AcrR family transcriptional regulator